MTSTQPTGDRTYYFISDLHIGGDEQLQNVEFEDELLEFLRDLGRTDEDVELIVNGDAFGLWEFTELEGLAKLDALVDRYPKLFAQLRETGRRIPITFIPGNHDYELACYPEYVDRLAEYNVSLEQEVVITRAVGDRLLWIEHGQQRDPNNRSPDFGDPHANPPGYFVNRHITSRAGKISGRGKFNWLKDIQSVTPMTQIPDWMISNYFYREMSPLLRYASLPFLLLFNVSVLYLLVVVLDVSGLWPAPQRAVNAVLAGFGIVGALIDAVLFVNLVIIGILVLLSIPLFFFVRDTRKTLKRFGLIEVADSEELRDAYVEGAREVFDAHPEVACFIYGHTHRPSVTEVDGRVVVNTGTWLKRLTRKSAVFGLLPWVFYPSYCLNYVRIFESEGAVVVEYHLVEKSTPQELTLLERLLTRAPRSGEPIPERTLVGPQPTGRSADSEATPSTRPSTDEVSG